MNIFKKIAEIRKELKKVVKNAEGFGFKYADYGVIKSKTDPLLEKAGLTVFVSTKTATGTIKKISKKEPHEFKKGKKKLEEIYSETETSLQTMIAKVVDVESGESETFEFSYSPDQTMRSDTQGTGSSYSYMRRYVYMLLFDLDFVEDIDQVTKPGEITHSELLAAYDESTYKDKAIIAKEIKEVGFTNLSETKKKELLKMLRG